MIEEIQGKHPEATAPEVWFQDEARVGQKGTLTRRWAPRGSRPRAIRDHRFKSAFYHLRWAQEENYKCFKCRVEVENWSGKSSLTIRQDFHAKVFTLNLTAVLTRTDQQQVDEHHGGDNHPKQVNLTHAL